MRCLKALIVPIAGLATLSVVLSLPQATGHARDGIKEPAPLTVFAAASLRTALDDVGRLWTTKTGIEVRYSYAASGAIARQIENAAPADVFVSADTIWMDYLAAKGLLRGQPRRIVSNALVLVAPAAAPKTDIDLRPGPTVAKALVGLVGSSRLALGNPQTVPAGAYAKAALTALEAWDALADRLAPAENVRVALAFVVRGEAALGVVYATDAKAEPGVRVLGIFDPATHPPIIYPAAVTTQADHPEAAGFVEFLAGPDAAHVFEAAGFLVRR